jgi:cell division protein FtsL
MLSLLLVLLFVFVLAVAVWFGYEWAADNLRDQRAKVAEQRAALDAEWKALNQTQKVRMVFFRARRAMQAESHRPNWPGA